MNVFTHEETARIELIQKIFHTADLDHLRMFVDIIKNENKLQNEQNRKSETRTIKAHAVDVF